MYVYTHIYTFLYIHTLYFLHKNIKNSYVSYDKMGYKAYNDYISIDEIIDVMKITITSNDASSSISRAMKAHTNSVYGFLTAAKRVSKNYVSNSLSNLNQQEQRCRGRGSRAAQFGPTGFKVIKKHCGLYCPRP